MTCCGQKRQAWRGWNPAKAPVAPTPPVLQSPTILRYLGTSSLAIKGAVSGCAYLFAGRDAELSVDERDVPALISSGRFVSVPPEKTG
jgi:hypothetical protein